MIQVETKKNLPGIGKTKDWTEGGVWHDLRESE